MNGCAPALSWGSLPWHEKALLIAVGVGAVVWLGRFLVHKLAEGMS